MSDSHINILRQVARQMQRVLNEHDAVGHNGESGSKSRRERLERMAKLARARLAEAERRRLNSRDARAS
jgi:hypothetical protein